MHLSMQRHIGNQTSFQVLQKWVQTLAASLGIHSVEISGYFYHSHFAVNLGHFEALKTAILTI